MTFLIHGFNVDRRHAEMAYSDFVRNIPEDRRKNLVWIYWPGDLHKTEWRSVIKFPDAVPQAVTCAETLHDLLTELLAKKTEPTEIRIVAHSLGCRLTLELLRQLRGERIKKRISVTMVALMAAAVPVWMVIEGRNEARLRLSKHGGAPTVVMHSKDDWVLKMAFKLGARGESASLRTLIGQRHALGRFGIGDDRRLKSDVVEYDMQPLDHSDYWHSYGVAEYLRPLLPNRFERDVDL